MRIAVLLNDLGLGGTQRLVTGLANHLLGTGHEVVLFTFDRPGARRFFALDPAVEIHDLNLLGHSEGFIDALGRNLGRIRRLRSEWRRLRPELILSFLSSLNVTALLSAAGLGVPVIVSEETEPAVAPLPAAWRWLRAATYPFAACIVVHAQGTADYFGGAGSRRVRVIPNPIDPCDPDGADEAAAEVPQCAVVAMGRLSQEKGFDVLIRAFASLAGRFPNWHLLILGEGDQRLVLEHLAASLGLDARVHLPGAVKRPGQILRRGRFFVSSSRYEGFSIAIGEAMACGLPVVSTDAPNGPRDIVRDGIDGLLVPVDDTKALARAMMRLMESPQLRTSLSRAALHVVDRFSASKIWGAWSDLVLEVGSRQRDMGA
jgi:glycosyltransferase involved in cell wall biosynthesis